MAKINKTKQQTASSKTSIKTKKSAPKRVVGSKENLEAASSQINYSEESFSNSSGSKLNLSSLNSLKSNKYFYLILIVAGLLLLFTVKKSWFVAATVNGSPISNFELLSKMNDQYRSQTLTQMINEKVIIEQARQKGIIVGASETEEKIAEIEKNVGGAEALNNLLSQQGQNRDSLKNQIRIQLMIEKLYSEEASVSAQEVDQFLEQNRQQLQASDSAGQEKEAQDILKQQKVSQTFSEKFPQLKEQSQIKIY